MQHFQIGSFPGDGIGPEVVGQALRVLAAVEARLGTYTTHVTHLPWGADHWAETGRLVPPDFLDVLAGFDAILFGALGDPARVPDHLTLEPLIQIRQSFDQYACVRPSRLYPGVRGPLAGKGP